MRIDAKTSKQQGVPYCKVNTNKAIINHNMILFAHMLFGAATGSVVKTPVIAIILAFFGHYFLDLFPHVDYSVENLKNKLWKKSLPDTLKIVLDIGSAFLIIFLFSDNNLLIYVCAIIALIPDSMTLISKFFPNKLLSLHDDIHTKKVHFLKYKKISIVWRVSTQVIAISLSIVMLSL